MTGRADRCDRCGRWSPALWGPEPFPELGLCSTCEGLYETAVTFGRPAALTYWVELVERVRATWAG